VRGSPDVAEATPIYFGFAKWKSGEGEPPVDDDFTGATTMEVS
jgi:hypothetical protein